EHIARDGNFQGDGIASEGTRHFWNRGDDDVGVDVFHEHRARDDERDNESFDGKRHGEARSTLGGKSGDYGTDMEQSLSDRSALRGAMNTERGVKKRWTRRICNVSSRRR